MVSLYCDRMLFERDAKQDSVNHARTTRVFFLLSFLPWHVNCVTETHTLSAAQGAIPNI